VSISEYSPTDEIPCRFACFLSSDLLEMTMPCWPDLWSRLRWMAGPALVLAVIVLLVWAPAVKWRWLRIVLRVFGGMAALCALVAVGLGMALNWGNPKPQYRTVTSPNGSHDATLTYDAGFLGRDFSSVEITKKSCCQHFTAYEYDGPSDLKSTTMVWVDDSHLQIEYPADPDRYQHCESRVADVTVICIPLTAGKN
jgi:hypothetical protein